MPQIKAYKCDRCGEVFEQINYIDITEKGKLKQRRYYCDNCLEEFYFRMQMREQKEA